MARKTSKKAAPTKAQRKARGKRAVHAVGVAGIWAGIATVGALAVSLADRAGEALLEAL